MSGKFKQLLATIKELKSLHDQRQILYLPTLNCFTNPNSFHNFLYSSSMENFFSNYIFFCPLD